MGSSTINDIVFVPGDGDHGVHASFLSVTLQSAVILLVIMRWNGISDVRAVALLLEQGVVVSNTRNETIIRVRALQNAVTTAIARCGAGAVAVNGHPADWRVFGIESGRCGGREGRERSGWIGDGGIRRGVRLQFGRNGGRRR